VRAINIGLRNAKTTTRSKGQMLKLKSLIPIQAMLVVSFTSCAEPLGGDARRKQNRRSGSAKAQNFVQGCILRWWGWRGSLWLAIGPAQLDTPNGKAECHSESQSGWRNGSISSV